MSEFDEEKLFSTRSKSPKANAGPTESPGGSFTTGQPLGKADVAALQRFAGNAAVAQMLGEDPSERVRSVVGKGGGQPLPDTVRTDMERRFRQDFSSVRTHTGPEAEASASSVQAKAYTVGDEIVLGEGLPSVDSPVGRRTLAHELTHVVQQRSGPVEGTDIGGGMKVSDPTDRFETEAESVASDVVSSPAPAESSAGPAGAPAAVQREGEESDEEEDEDEGEAEITDTDTDTGEAPADIGDTDYDTDTDTEEGEGGTEAAAEEEAPAGIEDLEVEDEAEEAESEEESDLEGEEEETEDAVAELTSEEGEDDDEEEDEGEDEG